MIYTSKYLSPLGDITITCDNEAIVGLWFDGQKHFASTLAREIVKNDSKQHPLLLIAKKWLDIYFSGKRPDFIPTLKYGSTRFRKMVCDIMLTIPYGKTMSYGEIAARLAKELKIKKMSAQAVGGAVGHNAISLIIPCHRVVGANGNLRGYAGGIDKKVKLLMLEKVDMSKLFIPKGKDI